jgi:hypothetical protein
MTTATARAATHAQIAADIRRCSEAPARAAHRDETVWESWQHLMNTCQFQRARQWWLEEIAPTFGQQ